MIYHASQIKDIKVLEPRVSNHNKPLVYFSSKRENVLVYLSNAVEKYCKECGHSANLTSLVNDKLEKNRAEDRDK